MAKHINDTWQGARQLLSTRNREPVAPLCSKRKALGGKDSSSCGPRKQCSHNNYSQEREPVCASKSLTLSPLLLLKFKRHWTSKIGEVTSWRQQLKQQSHFHT